MDQPVQSLACPGSGNALCVERMDDQIIVDIGTSQIIGKYSKNRLYHRHLDETPDRGLLIIQVYCVGAHSNPESPSS